MVEKLRCELQKYCKLKLQVQYLKQFQSHVQSEKTQGKNLLVTSFYMEYTVMATLIQCTPSDAVQHNIHPWSAPLQAKTMFCAIWDRSWKIHSNFHEALKLRAFDYLIWKNNQPCYYQL